MSLPPPLRAPTTRKVHEGSGESGLGQTTIDLQELGLVAVNHALEDDELRRANLRCGGLGDAGQGGPVVVCTVGIAHPALGKVAQGNRGKAAAEAEHAVEVFGLGEPVAVGVSAPAETSSAALGVVVAAHAKEYGTADAQLAEENVDERATAPAEFRLGKDGYAEDANGIALVKAHPALIGELRDHGLGEHVEGVEEEGGEGWW